jgi:hypothetical protein
MYAAADATPLFLMAMRDYYRASGDLAFLQAHKEAIEKAWAFETAPTSDTDHDGIYDNSQGTGWVESWPNNAMPHQEVYLALLDEQASNAYAAIAGALGDSAKAGEASSRAAKIKATIEQEYYDPQKGCYAFSHNLPNDPNGATDKSTTVYPAIAWWDYNEATDTKGSKGMGFSPYEKLASPKGVLAPEANAAAGPQPLAHPEACLSQWAAPTLDTDWGLRDVATTEPFYDGLSYHQGSVWPLFTGWAALAEYRAGQPLAGEQMLMQNADLTWAQDPGAVTELLSGDFFVPFGRSTSHQLWSSAMVITPTLRGLFGISVDAATKTITVNPHLPAEWDKAEVNNLRLGGRTVDLVFNRIGGVMQVGATDGGNGSMQLRSDLPGALVPKASMKNLPLLEIPLPAVEVGPSSHTLPTAGSRPARAKILQTSDSSRSLSVTIEGQAGSDASLILRKNRQVTPKVALIDPSRHPGAKVELLGAITVDSPKTQHEPLDPTSVQIHFPNGQGWQTLEFTLTW